MQTKSSLPVSESPATPPAPHPPSQGGRRGARIAVVLAITAISMGTLGADERSKLEAGGRAGIPRAAAVGETNRLAAVPRESPRPSVGAVKLAEAPSAAVVVQSSPLLDKPATAAMSGISARPPGLVLSSRMNRETLQDSIDHADRLYTPEQASSALRYLRRKPTWRGFRDLLDPTAPVIASDLPAAVAFEARRDLGEAPRAFRDAATHEPKLRLY